MLDIYLKRSLVAGAFMLSGFGSSIAAYAQSVSVLGNQTNAGQCYKYALRESESASAVASCTKSLSHENLTRRDRAAVLVNRGILNRVRWDVQAAYDDYQSALRLIPDLPEAIANRANVFYLSEKFDKALADYKTSLELGISDERAVRLNIALLYGEMKRYSDASAAYEDLLVRYPDWEEAKVRFDRYKARRLSPSES